MTRAHTATACNPDDSSESADDILETIQPLERQAQSLDELCEALLPSVAAHIWRACCWPARMEDGWKMGDHCFVVFSLTPERNTDLYVQFWSEPHEPVLVEVCSGEWSPGSVKYVQGAQRALLASLGYEVGGVAKNFRRLVRINSVAAAEAAGREMLRIFHHAFGYRGQWALDVRLEHGERAESDHVYTAVTPDDLAKLAAARGFDAGVDLWTSLPHVAWSPLQARLMAMLPGEHLVARAIEAPGADVPRRLRGSRWNTSPRRRSLHRSRTSARRVLPPASETPTLR